MRNIYNQYNSTPLKVRNFLFHSLCGHSVFAMVGQCSLRQKQFLNDMLTFW